MVRTLVALAAVLLVLAPVKAGQAQRSADAPPRPEDFPDVLSMTGRPDAIDDWPAARFADLGAWFGYTLPPSDETTLAGAFPGPFAMDEGAWVGTTFAQVQLEDDAGRDLPIERAEGFETTVFPGRLHQRFHVDGFAVSLDLVFASGRSAVIRASVTNSGKHTRRVGIGWTGEGIDGGGVFVALPGEVRLQTPAGTRITIVPMTPGASKPLIPVTGRAFRIRPVAPVSLAAGESALNYLGHVVVPAGESGDAERAAMEELARAPARAFQANERRWSAYLAPALRLDPAFAGVQGYRVAAVKALMTLLGNWRQPLGDLRHAGLVPSSAVHGFDGFRAVDSWKQAVALARIAPDLAQDQLRALFDHQGPDGMVPGSVSMNAAKHNRLHTGPPLAAWAAWEVYRQAGDRSVLHELLPLLRRYHDWWAERRDRDRDGLCEYGAAAERVEAAKAESGMDDAARFQKAGLRRVDDAAWTLDVESVDLNAYLFAEKRHLARITTALLREDPELDAGAARLQAAVRAWMFDRESAYFYDVLAGGDGGVRIHGPEGWIPLWAGLATEAQASAVRRALVDPAKFATALPFPTLGADQPGFDARGRWRGAVWLDQAYFAVQGLRRYGFTEDAHRLARQLLDRADGLTAPGTPIRENYDPLTGQGLSISDFSPSAAAVLLLLWGQ